LLTQPIEVANDEERQCTKVFKCTRREFRRQPARNSFRVLLTMLTMVLYTVALSLAISPWGIVTTYLNERFPTGARVGL
jgi:hypothetical protein